MNYELLLELLIMLDKLTDDGTHPEERTRFGEIIHEVFGSWQDFDRRAYEHEEA